LAEHQPSLLIAVDCGTASAAEVTKLRDAGVDVLIFDHHECPATLPPAVALVNPKRDGKLSYLCSAGVVFKVAHALMKRRRLAHVELKEYLDLVAVATVADLVPLVGENRLLVSAGLRQLARTRWIGLAALMEAAGVGDELGAQDVGFKIGPRMNAAGRLGTAEDALALLLAEESGAARSLARGLDDQNRNRQSVEKAVLTEAEAQVGASYDPAVHAAIVTGNEGWHPGVLGIVAARLMRSHHRPCFVVGFDAEGTGKGSGRSIEGLSLVAALRRCGEWLEKFGGHEMAAGLTVRREQFAAFQEAFQRVAREMLSEEQLQPTLRLDAELRLSAIDLDLLDLYEQLEPFGIGNAQPLFFLKRIGLAKEPQVLKQKHLSLVLRQGGGQMRAIWFGGAGQPLPPVPWDVAFHLVRNVYNDRVEPQIQIRAVRPSY
jgi:single-stranded-DNA-specific exonuclease